MEWIFGIVHLFSWSFHHRRDHTPEFGKFQYDDREFVEESESTTISTHSLNCAPYILFHLNQFHGS